MLGRVLGLVIMVCLWAGAAQAASFEVTNIRVSAQADDAVKARDMAITQAQRQAFATLSGQTTEDIASITDSEIARLVRGFSVQNERVLSRSYSAVFTVRFNPNVTMMFMQSKGFDLVERDVPLTASGVITAQQAQTPTNANPSDIQAENLVVLPVLDIGSRRILWDEPNPWREIWQGGNYSKQGLPLRVPLGDIDDLGDVSDARFLSGGQANIANMLQRYQASSVYIVLAKHESNGVMLSLYRHDGKRLVFVRKMLMHPRAGYMFNDAVPVAIQMIVMSQNAPDSDIPEDPNLVSAGATADRWPITPGSPMVVTVPYQSLPQWVGIQNRLRLVQGIRDVVPLRVSPSSAQVRFIPHMSNSADLKHNLAIQGFDLQRMPNGEVALIEK